MEKVKNTWEYEIKWFSCFKEVWEITYTFLEDIAWWFNWHWRYSENFKSLINFSKKEFYNLRTDAFVFKYSSLEELKKDSESWKKIFKKKNSLTSEKIDWNQVLESSWYFEYEWKFYLIWILYFDIDEENTDESKWLYKWVIVSPSSYFEGDEIIESLSSRTENNINWIV